MPVFRSFRCAAVLTLSLVLPVFAQSADEVRVRVEALEEAGEFAQAAELLEAEFELLQVATEDERALFSQLTGMLNKSGQADERIVALSTRLDADPEDRFSRYLLGFLYFSRADYAFGADVLSDLVRREPENLTVAGLFLTNCLGAGDDCPSLWPEKREDRPEITCEEAIEFDGIVHPKRLEPLENVGNREPVGKDTTFNELLQDPDKSWVMASAAYVGATIVQMEGSKESETEVAQAIILYDTIMGCFPDSEGTRYYREYTRSQSAQEVNGEEVFFQDLYFHENLRQNRLDLAWEVKGYDLEFSPPQVQE